MTSQDFPIEASFGYRGALGVSTDTVLNEDGTPDFMLFYPQTLGHLGERHPIVTWGNGTAARPQQYPGVLHQLASWGMVVVASTSRRTGKGHEMLNGVRYLLAQNGDKASVFFEKLDDSRIAAIGHSQGAGGAVNATINSGGKISVTVPICLPNERWVSKGDEYDVTALRSSALFLGGGRDKIVAGPGTLRSFFDRTPAPAAVAVLRGAGHNVIQKSGGGYLGYLTAWLRFHLFDDEEAMLAFSGPDPELLRNTAWQAQAINL